MKISRIISLLIIAVQLNCFCQSEPVVNIATLVVDFDTYEFEGGNISTYNCSGCAADSIPYIVDFNEPGDFGDITFTLTPGADTFFFASIIWMGTGHIFYPDNYSSDYPFSNSDEFIPQPSDIKYLDWDGNILTETYLLERVDSAWDAVDSLWITKLFSEKNYKAIIFLYAPEVGAMNPYVAKWIVFLYYKGEMNFVSIDQSKTDQELIRVYPNPSDNVISIECNKDEISTLTYSITDFQGKRMAIGELNSSVQQVDISSLNRGIYLLKIYDADGTILKYEKMLKR